MEKKISYLNRTYTDYKEALIAMSNGVASKIIVPTDAVNMTKSNVIFSETTGLGDVTPPAEKPQPEIKKDVCCD